MKLWTLPLEMSACYSRNTFHQLLVASADPGQLSSSMVTAGGGRTAALVTVTVPAAAGVYDVALPAVDSDPCIVGYQPQRTPHAVHSSRLLASAFLLHFVFTPLVRWRSLSSRLLHFISSSPRTATGRCRSKLSRLPDERCPRFDSQRLVEGVT